MSQQGVFSEWNTSSSKPYTIFPLLWQWKQNTRFWYPILTYWMDCTSKTINRTVIWLKTPFHPMLYTFYTPAFGSGMWQLNVTGRTSSTARASGRHVDGRTDERTFWRKMILLISPCSCHISWHANCAAAAWEKPEFNHNFLKARHTASSTGHWFTLIS
jgi:hypothetical protein